ncbi:uncharacterized protein LOC100888215 [Strongylocentrotus purpuratus]|uniref:Death domain-containing protein n=1 Tax=Strongylocentrotus purpuratus TaxID=7668 RepID=A0A7M7NA54_STRPU|nr:uncharacterized protein LOC100888215 [Strongylocentrotus purpuratus]
MAEKFDELKEYIEKNPSKLNEHLPRVLEEIKKDDTGDFIKELNYVIRDEVMDAVKAAKNKHEQIMAEICVECMKKKTELHLARARDIFHAKTVIKWKGHVGAIERILQDLAEPIEWVPTDREKRDMEQGEEKSLSWWESGKHLKKTIEEMIEAFSRDKILKKVAGSVLHLLTACMESASDMHIVVALGIVKTTEMTWEGTEKLFPDVLEAFLKWLRREDTDFEGNFDHKELGHEIPDWDLLEIAGKSSVAPLKNLMEYCLEQELEGEGLCNKLSVHGNILRKIILGFIKKKSDNVKLYRDLFPYVVKLLSCDVEDLEEVAAKAIGLPDIYKNGELMAPYGDAIADAYLDDKCKGTSAGLALNSLFRFNPEVVLSRIDRIVVLLEDMGTNDKHFLYMLLYDVSQLNSKVLVPHIDLMFEDVCHSSLMHFCFMTLANISLKHAEKFIKHVDRCVKAWKQNPNGAASACKAISSVGCLNKKEAGRCLKILFTKLKSIDPMWTGVVLMEVKRIGQAHKECLAVYKPNIVKLKKCQQIGVPDLVLALIDFLEGRSLLGLTEDVAEQREDIDDLDNRVTTTENDVSRIDETVAQQSEDIQNVKSEVNDQGERLDELKEVVDETVEKVEEIDHKTITNAPKWSRDVSKLLNPEHEHDWRFLAVRLGYSGEDIRNWALSPDPTMAILAEWYTTHKSSDATYAILSALEDMGRTDAAEIITQSLDEAELLVPKTPSDDSGKPPTVFLSYQWDHQPEVKAIKKHLEMAGFPCWMDIGQMGGGDQLFAKISQGMRSSKMVLCMVTEKYSNSENCNKEVNLANLLNKPIIPVLIDQTKWPPEGAMSMLFAQLLYIQFFNEKEYVRGEKFWEDAKFSELLGQISYHATPDESMVSDEYRDWIPQLEDDPVTVKKVSGDAENSPVQQQSHATETSEPPSVFISYQWDKQTEIKRLFSRLTGLGYHCWLDINQMGGGDPLYSKIDKGVRNAKVVISCVTPKYALSANCRREVSLSDALRKPIIPLLLEEMTWPPEGPMSMTFTQLLYIDFTKETTQAGFEDEKFDELIEKMNELAQPMIEVMPANEERKVDENLQTTTPKAEGKETTLTGNDATSLGEQPTPLQHDDQSEDSNSSRPPSGKKNRKSSTCLLL